MDDPKQLTANEESQSINLVEITNDIHTDKISHPIFACNPSVWMSYLYREVSVLDVKGQCHRGYVYTVDPVSQSIVLMQSSTSSTSEVTRGVTLSDGSKSSEDMDTSNKPVFKTPILNIPVSVHLEAGTKIHLDIIPGSSVVKINFLDKDGLHSGTSVEQCTVVMDSLFKPNFMSDVISLNVKNRKTNVINWLRKHHIEVDVDGDQIEVCGTLTVNPPYTPDNCVCTNEIILGRIQSLLKSMSNDISE